MLLNYKLISLSLFTTSAILAQTPSSKKDTDGAPVAPPTPSMIDSSNIAPVEAPLIPLPWVGPPVVENTPAPTTSSSSNNNNDAAPFYPLPWVGPPVAPPTADSNNSPPTSPPKPDMTLVPTPTNIVGVITEAPFIPLPGWGPDPDEDGTTIYAPDPSNNALCSYAPPTLEPPFDACDSDTLQNNVCKYNPTKCPGYKELFYSMSCSCEFTNELLCFVNSCLPPLETPAPSIQGLTNDRPTDAPFIPLPGWGNPSLEGTIISQNTPDPSNNSLCPGKAPSFNMLPLTCDSNSIQSDCQYTPMTCPGYKDTTFYSMFCSCDNNELHCAVTACAAPETLAPSIRGATNEEGKPTDAPFFPLPGWGNGNIVSEGMITDKDAPNPSNNAVCPLKTPSFDTLPLDCDSNTLQSDCEYTSMTCAGYSEDTTFYGTSCACFNNELNCAVMTCEAPPTSAPSIRGAVNGKPTDAPFISLPGWDDSSAIEGTIISEMPDPNNEDLCPSTTPSLDLRPETCDDIAQERNCNYIPMTCPGYSAQETFYSMICTCYLNEMICSVVNCLPPPPPEPQEQQVAPFCEYTKPNEGDLCGFKGACRYNPKACPDETNEENIIFDICKCRGGVFKCDQFDIACNAEDAPVCPKEQPKNLSACDVPKDTVCKYNPFGCPSQETKGVFNDLCTCNRDGEWICSPDKIMGCPRDQFIASDDAAIADDPIVVFCFPGDALVQILQTEETTKTTMIPMKELQIGDMVRVMDGTYEPVYSFGHKNTKDTAEFMELYTTNSQQKKKKVVLSSQHMVWEVTQDRFIPAAEVRLGHQLMSYNDDNDTEVATVISIRNSIRMKGMYAPFTPSGTIVVDHMVASSYVAISNLKTLVQSQPSYYSYQWMAHIGEFPHRAYCYYYLGGSSYCKAKETYDINGINQGWCTIPLQILNSTAKGLSSVVLLSLLHVLLSVFWIMEQIMLNNKIIVGLVTAGGIYCYKSSTSIQKKQL
mmetsp:Transcript_32306/g.35786  ORF Transcript_32306/g.35786 Transcript_32306/m.35786 type:complete len:984 (+) Transcript_32306:151-3102(+)